MLGRNSKKKKNYAFVDYMKEKGKITNEYFNLKQITYGT